VILDNQVKYVISPEINLADAGFNLFLSLLKKKAFFLQLAATKDDEIAYSLKKTLNYTYSKKQNSQESSPDIIVKLTGIISVAPEITKIIITQETSSVVEGELLFNTEGGDIYLYSYIKEAIGVGTQVGPTELLHSAFNRWCHADEDKEIYYNFDLTTREGTLVPRDLPPEIAGQYHLTNYIDRRSSLSVDSSNVVWEVTESGYGQVVDRNLTYTTGGDVDITWLDDRVQQMGSLVFMPAVRADRYNGIAGLEIFALNPLSQQLFSSWWWYPNICWAKRDESLRFNPGWYYGNVTGGNYIDNGETAPSGFGEGSPSDLVQVTFNARMLGWSSSRNPAIIGSRPLVRLRRGCGH